MANPKQTGAPLPTTKLQPAPQIHQHQPGKTIAQAVAHANDHVAAVENAAETVEGAASRRIHSPANPALVDVPIDVVNG
jgi:hypothetical protein